MDNEKIEYAFNLHQFQHDIFKDAHKGRSLRAIGALTGVSASTLSRIQNGHAPDMDTFLQLCSSMDADPALYFIRQIWVLKPTDTK